MCVRPSFTRSWRRAGRKDVGRRPLRNFGRVVISQVIPDPQQPRVEFAEEDLEQLALSIREKGQLSPIRVRWSESLEKWIIISGERRMARDPAGRANRNRMLLPRGRTVPIGNPGTAAHRKLLAPGPATHRGGQGFRGPDEIE